MASSSWASTSWANISLFFVAVEADRAICFVLSQSYSFRLPSIHVSATALMHPLTTPPSEKDFSYLKSKQLWGNIHQHVVGQWINGLKSWWIEHIGLWDCYFSGTSVQTWVGMIVQSLVLRLIVAFHIGTWVPRPLNIWDTLVLSLRWEEWTCMRRSIPSWKLGFRCLLSLLRNCHSYLTSPGCLQNIECKPQYASLNLCESYRWCWSKNLSPYRGSFNECTYY